MARRITTNTSDTYRGWVHERLLNAAVSVYARYGSAGATTRRIAAEAEVNEVTLFRHFGTKEALLEMAMQEAMRRVLPRYGPHGAPERLPAVPMAPHAELTQWCTTQITHLREVRGVLQYAFAENIDGAALCDPYAAVRAMHDALGAYVADLRKHGFCVQEARVTLAVSTLVSVLATDGLGRDELDQLLPSESNAAADYARLFLGILGITGAAAMGSTATATTGEGWWSSATGGQPAAFEWCTPAVVTVQRARPVSAASADATPQRSPRRR